MHFTAEHTFPASPDRVAALVTDPAFASSVALPDLSPPEVLEHSTEDGEHVLRLRYAWTGGLDPIARRLLGNQPLHLIQEVRLDPITMSGTLTLQAEADPGKLHGRADVTLTATDGGTVRKLDGDFTVKVPLVGSTAERKLLPGVLARFDVEAAALTARLRAEAAGR